jgi:anti-anti-sigma regulatory factor
MLEITVSVVQGWTVVGLKGALVRGEADHLVEIVEWLQEFGERRIALHTAAVDAVDVDGVTALVECHAALGASEGCLFVRTPSRRLHDALRRTGLEKVLLLTTGRRPAPDRARAGSRSPG